jgi:hypothetical protein
MDEQFARSRNPTDLPLSADVIRLITVANDESRRREHEFIGAEHLLLATTEPNNLPHLLVGLMREQKNIGAQVLADSGLTAERAFEFARGGASTG